MCFFFFRCNNKQDPLGPLYRTLLLEHDRVAGGLSQLNPHWEDGILFLEARRAITAMVQHITYTEFLNTVLGEVRTKHSRILEYRKYLMLAKVFKQIFNRWLYLNLKTCYDYYHI